MDLGRALDRVLTNHASWAEGFGEFTAHPSQDIDDDRVSEALDELAERLRENYPFFHPRYVGQMLKPPHPSAVAGYVAAMLVNPNNHAEDGGPATARLEREVIADFAAMFGFAEHLGHLTTSGTIANLEALYVARELHPGLGVAYSADSHYTHARMCSVLGMSSTAVAVDAAGRMDLDALRVELERGDIGTVVATAGTTGLGAIDPIHEILPLCREYGVRVHVDAAYGGFFTLLAGVEATAGLVPEPWRAIAGCDSVVVDPHKHGLQPYGCGAVLFADPSVARFYGHDSPYTYFTSATMHLGEISLECSRAGAAAAALWLTLRLFPLTAEGLGAVLAAGRRAALRWSELLVDSDALHLYQPPELDIVSYFPATPTPSLSEIDAASQHLLDAGMSDRHDPVYLSVLRTDAADFTRRHPHVTADATHARVLRSVLMKPESETIVDQLHAAVQRLARNG